MRANQFYCVSTGRKLSVHPDDIKLKRFKNRRTKRTVPMLVADDNRCSHKLYKIISNKKASQLGRSYRSRKSRRARRTKRRTRR